MTLLDIESGIGSIDFSQRQATFLQEMLRPERLPLLKENPRFTEHLQKMREQAEAGLESAFLPLKFSIHEAMRRVGDRDGSFGKVYFSRRYTLTAQALMTLVDETDEYLRGMEDLLWLICNEYTWATSNHLRKEHPPEKTVDLFAAETAQMLAEVMVLLEGRLHPDVTQLIRQRVEERVFTPIFNEARTFWWEGAPNNWAAVCAGSAGMAALVLEADRNRLTGMLRRVLDSMACYLQGFEADGGCAEGIAYWNYGFGFYVYFAESLRIFTKDRIDLLTGDGTAGERIRSIAEFPARIALSNQTFLNYSDAVVDMPLAPGLLSRVSERIGVEIPRPGQMPEYPGRTSTPTKWAHASRTLCWTDDHLFGERKLPGGTHFFPDLEWLIDRRYAGAGGEQMVAFSARGGHNLEPHNHNDLGHFILHVGGENVLVDLGQGHYGEGYDQSLNKTSEGHSVPRINGQGQAKGRDYRAKVLAARVPLQAGEDSAAGGIRDLATGEVLPGEAPGPSFVLDLTRAYPVAALKKFVRRFEWQPPAKEGLLATLSLTDSFEFASFSDRGPAERNSIDEHFISFREPVVEAGRVVWAGVNGRVTLEFDRDRLTPAVDQFEVSGGNHGAKKMCYRLRLSVNDLRLKDEVKLKFLVAAGSSPDLP